MRPLYQAMIAGALWFTGGLIACSKYSALALLFTAAGGVLMATATHRRQSDVDAELFNRALYGKENPRCYCPNCNAYLGHFYSNRIRMESSEPCKCKLQ